MPNIALEYRRNFQKNISILEKRDPFLCKRIVNSTADNYIRESVNGKPTLRVRNMYIESRFDPERSALRQINRVKKAKGFFIFLGCGLGYHINALLRNGGSGVLIEKDVDLFKAALFVLQPEVLARLTPLIGLESDKVERRINDLSLFEAPVVRHAQAIRAQKEYYNEIEKTIAARKAQQFASVVTQIESQKLWVKNILHNLSGSRDKYYFDREILGRFSGPVLLVASGPFLEDIVDEIKKYSERIPVFSLLPSVPYLLKSGIEPDLILTTDAGFPNRDRMIRGCKIPLITTYSADHSLVNNWDGEVYLFSHSLPLEETLCSVKAHSISIPMQGTSALVMIILARLMGFTEVFLGGYDFAFRGLKDHHSGAGFDTISLKSSSRINTWHTQVCRRLHCERYILAHDQKGGRVHTSHKLLLYRNWLENELMAEDLIRLNNGLEIKGIKIASQSIPRRSRGVLSVKRMGSRMINPLNVLEDFRSVQHRLFRAESDLSRFKLFYGADSNISQEAIFFAMSILKKRLEVLNKSL